MTNLTTLKNIRETLFAKFSCFSVFIGSVFRFYSFGQLFGGFSVSKRPQLYSFNVRDPSSFVSWGGRLVEFGALSIRNCMTFHNTPNFSRPPPPLSPPLKKAQFLEDIPSPTPPPPTPVSVSEPIFMIIYAGI